MACSPDRLPSTLTVVGPFLALGPGVFAYAPTLALLRRRLRFMGRGGAWSLWGPLGTLGLGRTSGACLWGLVLSPPAEPLEPTEPFVPAVPVPAVLVPDTDAEAAGSGWSNLLTIFFTFPDFLEAVALSTAGGSGMGLEGSGGLGFTSGFGGRGAGPQTVDSGADMFLPVRRPGWPKVGRQDGGSNSDSHHRLLKIEKKEEIREMLRTKKLLRITRR